MRRALALALTALGVIAAPAPAAPTDRSDAPVVINGAGSLTGVAPNRIAAFRYVASAGRWEQVPVQVDERHVVDLRAVHNNTTPHSLRALEYSDAGTLTGRDPNPGIDSDDEVAFMARDGGAPAPAGAPDPGGVRPRSGQAVRVTDPLDPGAAAWVYLYEHDGRLDPAAGRDYVDYDFELLAGRYPEDYDFDGGPGDPVGDPPANPAPPANPESSRVTTPFYSERFADRWITDELRIDAGSATGADILDRNRLGVPFMSDDPMPCPRSENTFAAGHGAFVANTNGPVRAIRDYIGANSGMYTQRRHVFYDRREDVTTFLRVHPLPVGPSDLLDYDSAAAGMTYRNDLMGLAGPGVPIDGNPDGVPTGRLTWELTEGQQGSLVAAHRIDTNIPNYQATSIYLDDSDPAQLPCTGDAQARGTSGPSNQQGLPRTDPTPRGGSGPLYHLTSHRTHFYGPPGVTAQAAKRLSDQTRAPLAATVTPRHAVAAPPPVGGLPAAPLLSLRASPTRIVYGGSSTLTGRLAGPQAEGRGLRVFRSGLEVGSSRTGAGGAFSLRARPRENARYAVAGAGVMSPAALVEVSPKVVLRAGRRRGGRARFSGRVCPAHPGRRLSVQRLNGRRWRRVARMRLRRGRSCSGFSRKLRLRKRGTFRAVLGRHAEHATGVSPRRRVR